MPFSGGVCCSNIHGFIGDHYCKNRIYMIKVLERLQGLVNHEIDPLAKRCLTEKKQQALLDMASGDCKRLLQYLSYRAVRHLRHDSFAFLIDKYQRGLVRLSDTVYGYRQRHADHSLQPVYQFLLVCFNKTLRVMEERYPAYFDLEWKAPDVQQGAFRGRLASQWERVMPQLKAQVTDVRLLKIVSVPVNFFLQSERTDLVSYRWLRYLKMLTARLAVWVEGAHEDVPWELVELLLLLNADTDSFRRYCTAFVTERMTEAGGVRAQLDMLCGLRRKLYPIQVKMAGSTCGTQPAVKIMLVQRLGDEITLLCALYPRYYTGDGAGAETPATLLDDATIKLLTFFSVSQLSFLLKLLFDNGLFVGENMTQLCRKAVAVFRTAHAAQISLESLLSKVYAPTAHAVEVVGDFVLVLHNAVMVYRKKLGMGPRGRDSRTI
jgi:hypothetical protein